MEYKEQEKQLSTEISVSALVLNLYLGWSQAERNQLQSVEVDIKIRPEITPIACINDSLEGTICYDQVCTAVTSKFENTTHKLIESLGYQIYKTVQQTCSTNCKIQVSLLKPSPPIEQLKKGARFTVGDF